ncbi:MAG: YfhO family protein [Alphaproteobacteria bacterium]|nr:YfhO family protein [Alphaproteobacteria bacterium]
MKERLKLISENRIFLYFISFCTPIFLMLLVCLFSGFYPFGDKAYLIWDSDIQFVPFLAQFKAIVSSGTDFVYSFAKAGGNGMLDFNACYIDNPLNFIAFLFPDNRLDVAFQAIVFVRIALILKFRRSIQTLLIPEIALVLARKTVKSSAPSSILWPRFLLLESTTRSLE